MASYGLQRDLYVQYRWGVCGCDQVDFVKERKHVDVVPVQDDHTQTRICRGRETSSQRLPVLRLNISTSELQRAAVQIR